MKLSIRQRLVYITSDVATTAVGWLCFNMVRFATLPQQSIGNDLSVWLRTPQVMIGQFVVPMVMVCLFALSGSYNHGLRAFRSRLDCTLNTFGVAFVGMLGIFFTTLLNDNVPERLANYELMLILLTLLTIPTLIVRLIYVALNTRRLSDPAYLRPAVILGVNHTNLGKAERLSGSVAAMGLRIAAATGSAAPAGAELYGADALDKAISDTGAKALIVVPGDDIGATARFIESLYCKGLSIFVPPDFYSMLAMKTRLANIRPEPLVDLTTPNISDFTRNMKRISDIAASAVALVLLAPVYAVMALAVKLDSPGPAFYRQERVGYHKRPFKIVKFRSMKVGAEPDGPALSAPDDDRVTRLGHFLRKYRIDELPQFWNVLKGEMSLVGPRPERAFFVEKIMERHPSYTLIHQVRPGITSWGMVKYGYAANVDQMVERLAYDLVYIDNVGLSVDLKILLHTVSTVLTGKGL